MYPPKHRSNGNRTFNAADVTASSEELDCWPGDRVTECGQTWQLDRDGSTWLSIPTANPQYKDSK